MKLLYVKNTASKRISSFERSAFTAARQAGLEITFACNTSHIDPQKMAQDCKAYGVKLVHIDFERSPFSLKNIKAYKQLVALMRQNHYDMVHCNTPIGGVVGRLAARKAHIPYIVYQVHGFHFWKGAPLFNWLCYYPVERFLARYTDLLITINQEDFKTAQQFAAKKVVLINGVGIDSAVFTPSTAKNPALRKELGIPQEAFVLLSVGELNTNKNHQAVLEALRQLNPPHLHYVLCGTGPLENTYKQFVKRHGLTPYVHFAGFTHDIQNYYSMANAVINPSLREGLPAVVMEAMACKLPVLASRIRGHVDLLPNSQFLFNPRKPAEIAACLQRVLAQTPTQEIEQNYKHLEKFSFATIVHEMKSVYTHKQPVKIIHLLPSNRFSGAEHVILQLMDLFKNDPAYEMWYVGCEGPIRQVLEKRGVKYRLLSAFSYREIKKAVNELQPDIIHAHDVRAGVLAALLRGKARVISHLHVNWPWMKRLNAKTLIYALALHRIKQVLGVSQCVCDEYKFRRVLQAKFSVLPNVLDEHAIYQKATEFTVGEPIDLLFVGRLTAQKNPLLFLQTVAGLVRNNVQLRAVMLGDGDLKETCQRYIAQHHLEQHVCMQGFAANPYPYMKAAKLLVMPSRWEGFGLVAVEAMLLGTPVIATPVGGLKDILLQTNSPAAQTKDDFIAAITQLLSDEPQRARLAQTARQHARQYTDLTRYKNQVAQYYKQVMEQHHG